MPRTFDDTLDDPGAIDLIRRFASRTGVEEINSHSMSYRAMVGSLKEATKRKGKQLFHPLRAALTAKSSGPGARQAHSADRNRIAAGD